MQATLISHAAQNWLRNRGPNSILHIFENTCNLINSDGEVLSIVNPEVGPGPFAVVLREPVDFLLHIQEDAHLEWLRAELLRVGQLEIELRDAQLWNARPDWESVRENGTDWAAPLLQTIANESANQPGIDIARGVEINSAASVLQLAGDLAGKGPGLTPSGDDYLMGIMHALWASFPAVEAAPLCQKMASAAVPRTTTLSGAWLHAAGQGKAAGVWHNLFDAIINKKEKGLHEAALKILSVGHSSGADALAGFLAAL
jgi:hypothetical protein